MNPKTLSCFVIVGSLALAAGRAQTSPVSTLPHLEKRGAVTQLIVDGKPFIILGGQVGNPAGFPDRMERAWPLFKALNANTIEFPIHWEQIEPFDAPRPDSPAKSLTAIIRFNQVKP
jgi:hypothetical protein